MHNQGAMEPASPFLKGRPGQALKQEEETAPRLSSRDLFGNSRRLIIEHEGREYCLLITRQGKLILNRGG